MQLQSPLDVEAEVSYGEASQRYLQVLRQAINDVEKRQDQLRHFFPDIHSLQNEISMQQLRFHFYSALKSTKKTWIPSGNIENVIRACANGQCEKSDITIDFYRYGGVRAVIALYLATKDYNWVFAQIEALSEKWRKILIYEVKKIKVNDLVPAWIGTCDRSPIREDEKPPRLNRHAKEKTEASRKRQRPRPAIFSNDQMPAPPAVSTPSLLESQQAQAQVPEPLSHENVPHYEIQPQISQADDIPPSAQKYPHDVEDGCGTQQTHGIQSPALLLQQDSIDRLQTRPETRSQNGRVLISNMINPPQKQPNVRNRSQVIDERSSERPRLGPPQIPGHLVLPGECQYWSFSFTSRHMVESLPEPFRTGMKMSNLWRKENESGGLAVTNCLSLYLPETFSEDALFVVRVGCLDGFNICNLFGFGDPDIPVSEEGAAKEDRD